MEKVKPLLEYLDCEAEHLRVRLPRMSEYRIGVDTNTTSSKFTDMLGYDTVEFLRNEGSQSECHDTEDVESRTTSGN